MQLRHTCIISRSWTYFRSVSTVSRMMLLRAVSCAFAGGGGAEFSEEKES